jgi:hypothetical protein
MMKGSQKLYLITNKDWTVIDGEPCRVLQFMAFSCIKEGKILRDKKAPDAILTLECKKLSDTVIKGYIWHKIDFGHLWEVFEERTIKENEEVVIFWTEQYYKYWIHRIFPYFMPKLRVHIYRKGWLDYMADPNNWQPESGETPSAKDMLTPILSLKWEGME